MEWTGGQIKNSDDASDVRDADLTRCHHLSGPLKIVDGDGAPAMPGDLLVVEFCNLGPLDGSEWGYCGTFDRDNGGGFLTDHFPGATKAIWDIEGVYCSSRHIPGVRFAGIIHPGLIGALWYTVVVHSDGRSWHHHMVPQVASCRHLLRACSWAGTAPSQELLDMWNKRETELVEGGENSTTLCSILHTRPLGAWQMQVPVVVGDNWLLGVCMPHLVCLDNGALLARCPRSTAS